VCVCVCVMEGSAREWGLTHSALPGDWELLQRATLDCIQPEGAAGGQTDRAFYYSAHAADLSRHVSQPAPAYDGRPHRRPAGMYMCCV
jgi:hypothetical protein